jgi:peptidoglycan glycosyltransferase
VNRPVRRLTIACLILFAALLVNANYLQVVDASSLRHHPGNARILLGEYKHERGAIVAGNKAVAKSVATKDQLKYLRTYPGGPEYAPITGFYSLVYGASGIEKAENDVLSGDDARLFVRRLSDLVTGSSPQGGTVVLTIDPRAQDAAYQGLAGKAGAVVALDPHTGAILALATSPSYDPTGLSSHDTKQIRSTYTQLLQDPGSPLLDRAISQTYPPGSTFKLVTSAAALSSGKYTPDSTIPAPPELKLPLTTATIKNFGGETCGNGSTDTIADALRISCNTAFANLGMTLGADALRAQAEKFGINSSFTIPMKTATSVFPSQLNAPQTAQSAIGQFDVRMTPLQMAMVAAAIGNNGVVMKPYLVKEIQAPDLSVLSETQPEKLSTAVTPQVASQLTSMMELVVAQGTGTSAQLPGITVAGKTGTAQHAKGQAPHAWFVCFAPAQDPKIAVAVLVEDGGGLGSDATGAKVAAPIAKAVMEAVLGGGQ